VFGGMIIAIIRRKRKHVFESVLITIGCVCTLSGLYLLGKESTLIEITRDIQNVPTTGETIIVSEAQIFFKDGKPIKIELGKETTKKDFFADDKGFFR
jgi:hypothetical protein